MRSMMSAFPTDNVKIIKKDLTVIEDVEALVDRNKIFIDDGSLNIEEGDIIEHVLPNGAKEQYLVIDRGFIEEHMVSRIIIRSKSKSNLAMSN